ncbi:MAG: hypothetical protein DRI86_05760, partial [Bacteroidetes bacterium]
IEIDELEEYLYYLIQRDTDALSSYKHLVYGLRKLYQLFGKENLELSLPSINRPNKIPVVLSQTSQIEDRKKFGCLDYLYAAKNV